MPEILIKRAQTGSGSGAYEAGDVVLARPDGHPWGAAELDESRFLVARVDLSDSEIAALTESITEPDPILVDQVRMVRRRARGVDLSRLPAQSIGRVAAATLRSAIREKV